MQSSSQTSTAVIEGMDSCFQVMAAFMDALQRNYKQDMNYARPLIPPQANMMYVLDEQVAHSMASYMAGLIGECRELEGCDIRFSTRHPNQDSGLCRLRMEFVDGMSFDVLRKLFEATRRLDGRLAQ